MQAEAQTDRLHALTLRGAATRISDRVAAVIDELLLLADLVDSNDAVNLSIEVRQGRVTMYPTIHREPRRYGRSTPPSVVGST